MNDELIKLQNELFSSLPKHKVKRLLELHQKSIFDRVESLIFQHEELLADKKERTQFMIEKTREMTEQIKMNHSHFKKYPDVVSRIKLLHDRYDVASSKWVESRESWGESEAKRIVDEILSLAGGIK